MKYNFVIFLISLLILQSCGSGPSSSSGISQSILDDISKATESQETDQNPKSQETDQNPKSQETDQNPESQETEDSSQTDNPKIREQFNSVCDTDYTHSFKTELFVNNTFNIIKVDRQKGEPASIDLDFNHQLVDDKLKSSESIEYIPCNDASYEISEPRSGSLKTHTNYQPSQIIYHYYSNPNISLITRDSVISINEIANHFATRELSGISIITEDRTFHYKNISYYSLGYQTATTYQDIHNKMSENILKEILSTSGFDPNYEISLNDLLEQ